jgi:hypothetical protein
MLLKNYRAVFIWLAVILVGGFASISSYAAELDGKYNLDLSNYIIFENGAFKQQYVITDFMPEPSPEETLDVNPDSSGRSPALENETICLVTGQYSVSSSSVQLDYGNDTCGTKNGTETAFFDAISRTVTIGEQRFSNHVSSVGTGSRATRELSITEIPVEGGEISEAPAQETSGAPSLSSASEESPSFSIASSSESATAIESNFQTWQSNVAQAMEDLNNNSGGMWYCSSGRPRLSATYWTWTSNIGTGGWIPNSQVKPSEAINWYFGQISNDEACTECLMAARASFYKGLLDTIGVEAFDSWFENHRSDLVISNHSRAPSPVRMNKPVSSEADLARGDWVYFQNWVTYRGCPDIGLMQGENAITQSSGNSKTFIGLGIPGRGGSPVLGQSILDSLRNAWQGTSCPQEREGQLRTDIVATASASYFERVINATTTTPPSGAGISIDGDFSDWGNVASLADSVGDGGIIDWDKVWFHESGSHLSFSYNFLNANQISNYQSDSTPWSIILDSDNQSSTGYPLGLLGADYLITGKQLYRYVNGGWSYMEDVSHAFNVDRVELAISKSSLGLSSELSSYRAIFWGYHSADNKSDYIAISTNPGGGGEVLER